MTMPADGPVRQAVDDIAFPNGMAVTPDGVPDGICVDAENAVWYADVPNRRCVRVAEGGEVLRTVALDRAASLACSAAPAGRPCSSPPPSGAA
ncbi:SMP-30/gluconolactonase/LRE family protein [Actinomadura madurae]|uniref:SMP-30/gluconolactonase/LRE family protein n=1 Tax=Actinomadura madurae TaxID=1993 RepID=UPI00202664D3|nr:SMP-30/gluconolactonase/LRE family protein [Actinomadura madurae]MCP9953126.1 hypothetical protein [Actinomadura madurae]MCP9969892.1 hypothetical protein [Actinomadura madurae]MCP9982339.1 hypothetical protein [Actinomadura madurae]MCQ0006128.1 hypothetical protein [Actinomadura madurae]MCQ0018588.1 hypothetical protein [Actinomadura madurae]